MLRLAAVLPDCFYTFTEIVEDMTALNAPTCWQETANYACDVMTDVEIFWVIDTYTFYTQAETTNAR